MSLIQQLDKEFNDAVARAETSSMPTRQQLDDRFIGIGGLKTSTATAAMPCTQGIALVVEDESPL
jgi:hypothetical protein